MLDRFEEVRLVDDAEFADMWVRSRSQTRKLAKGALRRELADKGIEADMRPAPWSSSATRRGSRPPVSSSNASSRARRTSTDRAERDKVTRRLASMLARKGYQPSQAFRIVGEVLDAAAGGQAETEFRMNRYP